MLADEPERVRVLRGLSLALAEHWLLNAPAGALRKEALERLAEGTNLVCAAASLE